MTRTFLSVSDFLLQGKDPSRPALRFVKEEYTYGDLQLLSEVIAKAVLRMGGQKGDRVVLLSENSWFWVASYLGVIRAGLVCVPLAPGLPAGELLQVLQSTDARIVFAQAGCVRRDEAVFAGVHLVTDRELPRLAAPASQDSFASLSSAGLPADTTFPSVGPDDLAALMFTSGSTAKSRGVMVSHANIVANTESIIESLGLTARDRIMVVLPFHYCFGASLLHTHLRLGAELVVDSRFMFPETILQRLSDTQCTGFAGVPSHFQILLRNSSLKTRRFPCLRYVQQAGGGLPVPFIRELRDALPTTNVFIMYGQTEATARLSCMPPEQLDRRPGSIGKGIPGVALRVVDDAGSDVGVGEIGEIIAAGDNITQGYWRNTPDPAGPFRGRWLYTGDLATVDEDGFIYIMGRARDFLKCGGERISCLQIEEQLLEFEDLLEAVVVGMPDDVLGEAVKAFVVPRPQAGNDLKDRLLLFCRARFAPRFVPKEIVVTRALPKNSGGKVQRSLLKDR